MRLFSPGRSALATMLAAVSGFAAGSVFGPALAQRSPADDPALMLLCGLAGAVLYFLLLALTAWAVRGKQTREYPPGSLGLIFALSMLPLISYFPYLLYRSTLEGESVELPPLDSRYSAIILLVWSLILLACLLRLHLGHSESRIIGILTRRPPYTLAAMMALWLAVFFPLDVLKDHYMHVTTINSAVYRAALLNVFSDQGFMYSSLALGKGASIFAAHFNAILVLILPLFRLWPDYRFLLFISDVALALSAIPAYLIARRRFSPPLSLLLAAMLLFHPILTAQPGRGDVTELRFAPLFFLCAFYMFEKKRPMAFALFSLLLLTIREDMGIFVALFGIFALFRRRSWKWVLAPLIAGAGWFVATAIILLPRLSPTQTNIRTTVRYSTLGSSGSEIVKTIFFRPWRLVTTALSTPSHIGAAYGLFLSFGMGIPLLSGAVILALPAVGELLFQQTTTLVNFMALLCVPTLMAAYILGLNRLDGAVQRLWGMQRERAAAYVGIFMFFVALSVFHTWFNPGLYKPRYNYDAAREALSLIPEDASVRLPEFMFNYALAGQEPHGFHQITYQLDLDGRFDIDENYILMDRRIPVRRGDNRYYNGLEEVSAYLEGSQEFTRVYSRDDLELYVRKGYDTR